MKKILILVAMAVVVFANGPVVGAEASYVKSSIGATASYMGASASDDYKTNTKGLIIKAGYEFSEVMVAGYYLKDTYSEGPLGDKNAGSFGVEAIYITPLEIDTNFFMGGNIGKGSLEIAANDFGLSDVDFTDIGVRAGVQKELNDTASLEAGVKIVKRIFDDLNVGGVKLEMDETQVGLFVGIKFNL